MKKLVLSIIASISLFGFDIMPYGAYLDYSNSIKNNGYIFGIYSSNFFKTIPFKLEIDLEHTLINYKDNIKNWKQNDLTFIGNFYKRNNLIFKGGIHYINVRQNILKEDNYIYILGASYYKTFKYNFGIDFFYGDYKGFNTYQISPKVGINFGYYYSKIGSFYLESTLNHIHMNKILKSKYTNIDIKFQNFKGLFTTTLKASFGKSSYKVANGGFIVYNLSDEYKNSYGVNISYTFKRFYSIKVGYTINNLNSNQNSYINNVYTISYYRTF